MQGTVRSRQGGFPRIFLIAVGFVLLVGFAAAFTTAKSTLAVGVVAVALLPVLVYIAYRWPIIFPFGIYALTVPFDPLLKAASGTGGTVTRFIGIVTMAALMVHAFRMRRLIAPPVSWLYWGAYLLWAFCTWLWSVAPEDTAIEVQILGSLFALYTVAAVYPVTPAAYVWARRAVVFSGVFTSWYGFYAYATGQRLGATRLALASGKLLIDPNHYAAFFSIPIAILAARCFSTRSVRERLITAGLALPMFLNVLLTGSRGGLISASFVIVYCGIRSRKYKILGTALVIGFLLSLAIPTVWQRAANPGLRDDASGRTEIWNVGFHAMQRYGLFGSGYAAFQDVYDDTVHNSAQRQFAGYHRPAHNVLIETIVELGIPGLILLFAGYWMSIRQNANIPRGSPYFPDRTAFEAATIGIFISALSIDLMWFKYLWLDLMMVVLLANVYRPRLLAGRQPVTLREGAKPAGGVRAHARL